MGSSLASNHCTAARFHCVTFAQPKRNPALPSSGVLGARRGGAEDDCTSDSSKQSIVCASVRNNHTRYVSGHVIGQRIGTAWPCLLSTPACVFVNQLACEMHTVDIKPMVIDKNTNTIKLPNKVDWVLRKTYRHPNHGTHKQWRMVQPAFRSTIHKVTANAQNNHFLARCKTYVGSVPAKQEALQSQPRN